MSKAVIFDIASNLLTEALFILIPVLAAFFITALFTGILTSYTRLSEPAIGLCARIAAVSGVLIIYIPWMGNRIVEYASTSWTLISGI
ncbi:MAG: flagellar biosynthetic protein FliQ [Deltaproteobacteria bacterium]|nr:flagellar biosynthetic protein FliQ [Deltaproteobacteria bacterium]